MSTLKVRRNMANGNMEKESVGLKIEELIIDYDTFVN
jgi:hypothetical protein